MEMLRHADIGWKLDKKTSEPITAIKEDIRTKEARRGQEQ